MYRCLNDLFGYCSGEPKCDTRDEFYIEIDIGGKARAHVCQIPHCERDPKTCRKYRTFSESLQASHQIPVLTTRKHQPQSRADLKYKRG